MTPPPCAFSIPPLPAAAEAALRAARLIEYHSRNSEIFTDLVVATYASFLVRTSELRQTHPSDKALFDLFHAEIKTILTAATSQIGGKKMDCNGLAKALLWDHMHAEGLLHWQDFYGTQGGQGRIHALVNDLVHYIVAKGFESGAANHASDPKTVVRAEYRLAMVNEGKTLLKPV